MSPPRSVLDDPERWRQRAEKARRIAEQLDNPTAKAAMISIAEQYEQPAEAAQQRISRKGTEAGAS